MNHLKAVLIAFVTVTVVQADVLVDDMSGIANKTYTGGYVFDIYSDSTTWEWPDPGLSWQYFDPQDFGLDEEGQFARVHGTLGGAVDYPFIGYGSYLVQSKDTMDLSRAVTHFAFRARGVGNWRFKFKNKLIDSLAVQAGKESDQVAWMASIAVTEQWQWFVLSIEDFAANVGDVNTLFTRDGYTAADPLTSIYKVYWQTDGYTAADQGTEVRIDVDDFYLLGSITELGMSSKEPTAEHCAAINAVAPGACGNSAVRWPVHRGRTRRAAGGQRRIYSVNGKLIHRTTDGREAVVPNGVYLVNTPGEPAIRATSVNGDK